jgi:protoporphyrinogen oxidase
VGRIQNFNNWSLAMVPIVGMTCLGMEYFCFKSDGLWNRKDEELIAQGAAELETLGLGRRSDVVDGTVLRMPKAYPIYDAAYKGHLAAVRECLDPIANLHTVGRNGMHQYNNQDHSMLAAMLTAANMQGASYDPWDTNTGFEYHEEQRLEPSRPRSTGGAEVRDAAEGA